LKIPKVFYMTGVIIGVLASDQENGGEDAACIKVLSAMTLPLSNKILVYYHL